MKTHPRHARPYSVIRDLNAPPSSPRHKFAASIFDSAEFRQLMWDVGPGNPYRGAGR